MGFLFTSNNDKLSEREIKKALREAGILETSDKQRIKQLLKSRRSGGISKQDVIDVSRRLKRDSADQVDRTETAAARRELLKRLEDEDK